MTTTDRWTTWRKSSFSDGTNAGNCVEVALSPATVAVRDSKNPDGPHLHLPCVNWRLLTA